MCSQDLNIQEDDVTLDVYKRQPQIMRVFRKEDLDVNEIGTWAMRFQCLTLPLSAWIIMSNMLTQTIGYGFRLYAYLSSSLIRWGGTKGERLVRQVIVQYAQEKGAHIRQHQEEKGISINLKNLFLEEPCCGADPRFYRVNLRDTRPVSYTHLMCGNRSTIRS